MKNTFTILMIALVTGNLFPACSASDEVVPISIPSLDDDVCCSVDDEKIIGSILAEYKEVTGLSRQSVDGYTLKAYARTASLVVGYNDIYFAVEKTENDRHVKDFALSDLSPLMDMGMMKHSTPIANTFDQVDNFPIYHTWVAPLMAGDWTLSLSYRIKDVSGTFQTESIKVESAPNGQEWIKSFKWNDATYYLTLGNPLNLKTGTNTINVFISKKNDDSTKPYLPASEVFTIDIDPRMPDMGNHTSPNNEPLELSDSATSTYQGILNLTMTGLWRIHLTVKNAEGDIVAGGDDLKDGFSSLFFDVTL